MKKVFFYIFLLSLSSSIFSMVSEYEKNYLRNLIETENGKNELDRISTDINNEISILQDTYRKKNSQFLNKYPEQWNSLQNILSGNASTTYIPGSTEDSRNLIDEVNYMHVRSPYLREKQDYINSLFSKQYFGKGY